MTPDRALTRLAIGLIASGLASWVAGGVALAAEPPSSACKAPNELLHLTLPLPHVAVRLAHAEPVKIVAIGSSSTAGAGASSKSASYPSRLETELQAEFPFEPIKVINRGVNGEEMREMLARFDHDVIAEHPDLVLWQVGTNSVLREHPLEPSNPLILEGVQRLKAIGADVVMVDPQFAPKVIARPEADGMVKLISATSKQANVDLIQRFAIMRYWHDDEHLAFSDFLSPDELHMNDWSYGCLAKLISAAITEAATRGVASAQAAPQIRKQ
jgi:acyl-CoA thioesterase I